MAPYQIMPVIKILWWRYYCGNLLPIRTLSQLVILMVNISIYNAFMSIIITNLQQTPWNSLFFWYKKSIKEQSFYQEKIFYYKYNSTNTVFDSCTYVYHVNHFDICKFLVSYFVFWSEWECCSLQIYSLFKNCFHA